MSLRGPDGPGNGRVGAQADTTRVRILNAAAHVFRHHGYAGARLTDIASGADIRAASLYRHFSSREAIVEEVLRVANARTAGFVRSRVRALPANASPLDRLRAATEAHLLAVLELDDYAAANVRIIGQVPRPVRERQLASQRNYGMYWRQLLQDAQRTDAIRRDIDLSSVRMSILGGLNYASDWFRSGQALSGEDVASQFMIMMLNGLATQDVRLRRPPDPTPPVVARVEIRESRTDGELRAPLTRKRILDAAATVIGEKGYSTARLSDISALANLHISSLYYHFDSREELIVELVKVASERTDAFVRARVDALGSDYSSIDRLNAAIIAHTTSILRPETYNAALLRIITQVPAEISEQVSSIHKSYSAYWRDLLCGAQAAGELRAELSIPVIQALLMGAMNWTGEWYRPTGKLGLDELSAGLADTALRGLAPRAKNGRTTRGIVPTRPACF